MSVIRVEKTANYTVMSNYHFKEKEMSLKAKGLLSLMLSLPDSWDYTISGLVSLCKENETAIRSALRELERFGYLKIVKNIPTDSNGGRISYDYIVYEKPLQKEEKQEAENLYVETQYVENPVLLNTNILNTKELNTNNKNIVQETKFNLLKENVKCIIDYLNDSTGKHFTYNKKETISLISARFREGYTLDDFYDVIDKKVKEWLNTDMDKYLRPSTLFGNKFEGYVNSKMNYSTVKTNYSSYVDNTINHFTGNKPISDDEFNKLDLEQQKNYVNKMALKDMTPLQRSVYEKYCLARDEFGNLLKF